MPTKIKKNIIERLKTLPIEIKSSAIYSSFAKGIKEKDSDTDILLVSDDVTLPKRETPIGVLFIMFSFASS